MKTKLLIILMIASFICFNKSYAQAQAIVSDQPILTMLNDFYKNYITAFASVQNSEAKLKLLQKENCTLRLLGSIKKISDEIDADPFLYAQDADVNAIQTLSIKRTNAKLNFFRVQYTAGEQKLTINLSVKKQESRYKIDSVWYNRVEVTAVTSQFNRNALSTIKNFYASYLMLKANKANEERVNNVTKFYFTADLFNRVMADHGAKKVDPLLRSTINGTQSINSLSVKIDPNDAKVFIATYLDAKRVAQVVHFNVVQKPSGIKIDKIY